jgi:hypothetical protein
VPSQSKTNTSLLLVFSLICLAVYVCGEAGLYTGRTAIAVCFLGVAVNPGLSLVPAVEKRLWLLISSNSSYVSVG